MLQVHYFQIYRKYFLLNKITDEKYDEVILNRFAYKYLHSTKPKGLVE